MSSSEKKQKETVYEKMYLRFERMGIAQVFFFWIIIIVLFGIVYLIINHHNGQLVSTADGKTITSLMDSIYFSFITATATGFGDIVPQGINKLISLFEVIVGLTIFALITSKIVGIKQERILREIYEISLQEKIHRIRSSLYLYRADIGKIISKIEDGGLKKRELAELWTFANYFEQRILEITGMFSQKNKGTLTGELTGKIDIIDIKLLTNSIVHSITKTKELFEILEEHENNWKRDITIYAYQEVIKAAEHALQTMRFEQGKTRMMQEDWEQFQKNKEKLQKILR